MSSFGSFSSATPTLLSQNQNEWERLAKKECFDILCTVIFTRRHKLLVECQGKDIKKNGTVSLWDWVQVCRLWVHPELPWFHLHRHLVTKEDERILYIPFLERYQNILASKCMRQWVKQIRPYIAERLCARAKGSSLNFSELSETMRLELPGLDMRSVYCFLMASDVFPGHSINIKALKKQALKVEVKAPGAIDLWVMRECRSIDWEDFKERWVQMVWGPRATSQEFPNDPIAVQAFVGICSMMMPGTDSSKAKVRWEATGNALMKNRSVDWEDMMDLLDEVGDEWKHASQVLDIVKAACLAKIGLSRHLTAVACDESGNISRHAFASTVTSLLGKKLAREEACLIFDLLDTARVGKLPAQSLTEALEVVDTWGVAD